MKKIVVSISTLVLALGVLSGCGEKKEEAPKAEAPKAEAAKPANAVDTAAQAVADASQKAAENTAKAIGDAATATTDAAKAAGDAAKAVGDTAAKAVDATAQAAGDAAKAAGDAAKAAAGAATQVAGAVDGEKVYQGLCITCHDQGIAGAPKMGDKADWGPRIAKGADALHKSAIEGRMNITPGKMMPPKGGNPALSDAEVKAAVDFMISKNK